MTIANATPFRSPTGRFAKNDPGNIGCSQLAHGKSANGDRHGLRARIATHRRDDRHEDRKRNHLLDGRTEKAE